MKKLLLSMSVALIVCSNLAHADDISKTPEANSQKSTVVNNGELVNSSASNGSLEKPINKKIEAYELEKKIKAENKATLKKHKQLSKKGYADSSYALSKIYYEGQLGQKKNEKKGLKYLELASNKGLPIAQIDYSLKLLDRDDQESKAKAKALLEGLANNGVVTAAHQLALLHLSFDAIPDVNPRTAISLLEKNADRGYIPSIELLGEMNYTGSILVRNLKNAALYYDILAKNNVPEAAEKLKLINAELDSLNKEVEQSKIDQNIKSTVVKTNKSVKKKTTRKK